MRWIAGCIVGALIVTAGGWLLMVDDPDGGEPVALVPIDAKPPAGVDPTTVATVAPGPAPATPDATPETLAAAPPINPHDIIIRDAATGSAVSLFTDPVDGLLERTPYGLIPRVGASGIRPVDAYARPDDLIQSGARARIAVVVTGLGLEEDGTVAALSRLPGEMTLAFAAEGDDLDRWVARARDAGHEVLLQVPFDQAGNPGGRALLADASPADNLDSLHWLMSRMTTYVGVTGVMDRRFATDQKALAPLLDEIGTRGLLYLDSAVSGQALDLAAARSPVARADLTIDASPASDAINRQLGALEEIAKKRGFSIGTVAASPVTVGLLVDWAAKLRARGIALVPVTALARG